jgi:hypothetical protein
VQRCRNSLPLALVTGGQSGSHGRVRRRSVLVRDGAKRSVIAGALLVNGEQVSLIHSAARGKLQCWDQYPFSACAKSDSARTRDTG